MWVEKYRPRRTTDMVGNEEARLVVSAWLQKWKPHAKAMLMVGPPGTGKTTLATLLAEESGMKMVALNASDVRTKDKLGRRIGEATKTVSLFGGRSLIFLDEVDGLLGRSDYGGVEFIKETREGEHEPHHHGGQRPGRRRDQEAGRRVHHGEVQASPSAGGRALPEDDSRKRKSSRSTTRLCGCA